MDLVCFSDCVSTYSQYSPFTIKLSYALFFQRVSIYRIFFASNIWAIDIMKAMIPTTKANITSHNAQSFRMLKIPPPMPTIPTNAKNVEFLSAFFSLFF